MYDILIKNGTVVDGTGLETFNGNIAIKDEKMYFVDDDVDANKVIDAQGKIVTPGFIDTHSHSSMLVIEDPYLAPKLFQGITTELVAQDGMGPAPVNDKTVKPWKKAMAGLEGEYEYEWDWRNIEEYLNKVDKLDLGPNIAYLAPHGNLRMVSMGLENRKPTAEEQERMNNELQKAFDAGAFGMSTGMIYPPCVYADIDE